MAATAIDGPRLEAFMGQAVVDLAAAFSAPLVRLGARLGLYRALAEGGPATPTQLAERTGTEPRMVREWLGNQAAGGYVSYDDATGRYTIPPEQAIALADEESEFYLLGAYDILASFFADRGRAGRSIPERRRPALGRARSPPVRRNGGVLPCRVQAAPGAELASRARWRGSEARGVERA